MEHGQAMRVIYNSSRGYEAFFEVNGKAHTGGFCESLEDAITSLNSAIQDDAADECEC